MILYIVITGEDNEGYIIVGIYSKLDNAKRCVQNFIEEHGQGNWVQDEKTNDYYEYDGNRFLEIIEQKVEDM